MNRHYRLYEWIAHDGRSRASGRALSTG